MAAATSALRKGARPLHDRCTMPLTAKAERRKRRKASEVAAASVEPTVATEAPEPPAEPHNESEMEVEPAAPDQTANRLLLMTAEHEAAVARRVPGGCPKVPPRVPEGSLKLKILKKWLPKVPPRFPRGSPQGSSFPHVEMKSVLGHETALDSSVLDVDHRFEQHFSWRGRKCHS